MFHKKSSDKYKCEQICLRLFYDKNFMSKLKSIFLLYHKSFWEKITNTLHEKYVKNEIILGMNFKLQGGTFRDFFFNVQTISFCHRPKH